MKKFLSRATSLVLAVIMVFGLVSVSGVSLVADAASSEYIAYLEGLGFPESYATRLAELHERHPSWVFQPLMVTEINSSYTWDYVISQEMVSTRNLITTSSWAPSPWNTLGNANYSPYYDTSTTALGDSGLRQASQDAVEYFMDPRNFMNDKDIFQFQSLEFSEGVDSLAAVNKVLSGYYLGDGAMCDNGITYAEQIYNSAKENNISSLHVATRLISEHSSDDSPLINGCLGDTLYYYATTKPANTSTEIIWGSFTAENLEAELAEYGYTVSQLQSTFNGLYNFFDINACGTGKFAIYFNGGQECLEYGYTSKAASIAGGTQRLAEKYIQKYQNTLYTQKFNVDDRSGRAFWGQYMQNTPGALLEGRNLYKSYVNMDMLESPFVFTIPVYSGMSESVYADPANGNSYYSPSVNDSTTLFTDTTTVVEGSGTVYLETSGSTSHVYNMGNMAAIIVTPASGYKVTDINCSGNHLTIENSGQAYVYAYQQPAGDVTISVTFEKMPSAFDGNPEIIFDNTNNADWLASGYINGDTTVELGTDPDGDTCMVITSPSGTDNDPYITLDFSGQDNKISADTYKYVVITAKTSANVTSATVFPGAGSYTYPSADGYKSFSWINDGNWHDYVIDLSNLVTWTGTANLFRLDYFDNEVSGNQVLYLRSIRFLSSEPSTPTISVSKSSVEYGENITFTYKNLNYSSYNGNCHTFIVIMPEGTAMGDGVFYQKVYLTGSGTATFPGCSQSGTYNGSNLPAGNYVAYLGYDAFGTEGTSMNFNMGYVYGNASVKFTITSASAKYVEAVKTSSITGKKTVYVPVGTTCGMIAKDMKLLDMCSTVTVLTASGAATTTATTAKTGFMVTTEKDTYNIVILGDVNGDGCVTMSDVKLVMKAVRGETTLANARLDAAKGYNETSATLSILDVTRVMNIFLDN